MDVEPAAAPSPNPLGRADDNEMSINYEDAGCYATTPGNWVVEGPWMSWSVSKTRANMHTYMLAQLLGKIKRV